MKEECLSVYNKTQKFMNMLKENKQKYMDTKQLLFQMVDRHCQSPAQVTPEMLMQVVPSVEQTKANEYVMEVARMIHVIRMIEEEQKHGFELFSKGVSDSEGILTKYQDVMFALRRIELGPDGQFADTGAQWIIMNQISPVAVKKICQERTFVNKKKIYQKMMYLYESAGAQNVCEIYHQFMREEESKNE